MEFDTRSPAIAQLRNLPSSGGCVPAFFMILEIALIPSTSIRGASDTNRLSVSCAMVSTTAPANPLTSALLISIVLFSSLRLSIGLISTGIQPEQPAFAYTFTTQKARLTARLFAIMFLLLSFLYLRCLTALVLVFILFVMRAGLFAARARLALVHRVHGYPACTQCQQ